MKYKAVIFDLFGTLVDVYSRREYEKVLAEMASILSIPDGEFRRQWSGSEMQRNTGGFQSIEENLSYICNEVKVTVTEDVVQKAAAVRYEMSRKYMEVDKGGVEVVAILKSRGYKTALISNCSPDAPLIWDRLPYKTLFDVVIFSCEAGLEKPDHRIYELAVERLAVEPGRCLYIGDGAGDELAGAAGSGMTPVLIRDPDENSDDVIRGETFSTEWDGPVIASLKEVLNLVK